LKIGASLDENPNDKDFVRPNSPFPLSPTFLAPDNRAKVI
jgi:hypothetical protein